MKRTAWLGSMMVVVAVAVSALFADPGVVRTRDGSSFEGELTDGADNVTVTIRGVETVIPKSEIVTIDPVGNFDQVLQDRSQKLDPKDTAGRVLLAREAFDRKRYMLARDILAAALVNDPNDRDASSLLDLVNSQIRMERAKIDGATATTPPTTQPQPAAPAFTDRRLLTPADIEAIRRKELRPTDTTVLLRFEGDVKKRFADHQNIPFPDFNTLTPLEQAMQILDKGDETTKARVRVMTDPSSMLQYRRQVQPLVMQGCATTGCHGASPGGGFMLFTTGESDVVTYTNFYILQSYTRPNESATGVFKQRVHRLIMRGHGEDSLLANYGLPAAIGDFDHPLVRGRPIQPIFRNRDDARYRMLVDWMNNSLSPFEPNYGILYTPPMPTTVPARQAE